ncbi:MAG: type 1 glutamine amidotransferase [Polyangiaceae bacterium]|nr:type 1 glutamine amidotransferase [Polyangiaceae bacterium]
MHRPVLVLMHARWETEGLIKTALDGLPVLRRMVVDEPSPELPRASDLGGLVVMGGPQDADDDVGHPGLAAERRLLSEAVDVQVPVLGVCLGMQLLALALGAKLHRRHGTEIGFAPVELTRDGASDPVLGPLERASRTPVLLHWHSDAADLPAGATLLARTPKTPVQSFRAGPALGVQFHPEADAELLGSWLATAQMLEGLGPSDVARIGREGAAHLPRLREPALAGLSEYATAVRVRRG